ncbi:unnamed protein product [uncultured bacterium]|nr:unnamed protein product [uncultured bacterium]
MTRDDDFDPKLGKIRSRGSTRGRRYLQRVLRAVALAGGIQRSGASPRRATFHGSRIGRGAGVGRVLASRDRYAAYRQRRVIIKSRIVKLAGNGVKGAQAHLRYIQRDGVTRDGQPGELYSADQDRADGKGFLERGAGDRHQFRFIVSVEDGVEYDDLKPFIRRLMAQMEEDLGTRLDWVAVDHYNTGHPHSHVLVRGRTNRNKDLIIAREYITEGMRERAAEIVRLDLGPRSDFEIEDRLRDEVGQERFTSIDRTLLREQDGDGLVWAVDKDAFQQSLRAGRLQKLKRLGLAEEAAPGQWRLDPELEPTLRRMGERGDIIKTLHRDLAQKGLARAASDYAIYDPSDADARPIVGRLVRRGLSDEINDRNYLIVDGVDDRTHYVKIGKGDATDPVYSVDIHLQYDPTASAPARSRWSGAMTQVPSGSRSTVPMNAGRRRMLRSWCRRCPPCRSTDSLAPTVLPGSIGSWSRTRPCRCATAVSAGRCVTRLPDAGSGWSSRSLPATSMIGPFTAPICWASCGAGSWPASPASSRGSWGSIMSRFAPGSGLKASIAGRSTC